MKTVAIVSGGLDSVTLAYYLKSLGHDIFALSFDYGQRHKKELEYARRSMEKIAERHEVIDLSSILPLLGGSSLTDNIPVPDGHYAAENMRITVVPNRNAIMLTIAFAAAVSWRADYVATAVHAGDHFIYPDCRPDFLAAFGAMQDKAIEGFSDAKLFTPFANMTKAEIVKLASQINAPLAYTWSCYKGGEYHCGTCGTCVERKEAFQIAGVNDYTVYSR